MTRQSAFPVFLVAAVVIAGTVGSRAANAQSSLHPSQLVQKDLITDDPSGFAYVIPASAHAPGKEGTSWVSDAVLFNNEAGAATVDLWFLKKGQDNSAGEATRIMLPGRTATRLVDFVLSVFGEDLASGALLIASDNELVVGSRTFNNDAEGTYGQHIPGIPIADALANGMEARLIQLTRNSGFRTNIGFANITDQPLYVSVDLRRANGDRIAFEGNVVQPRGFLQKTDIIGEDVDDAYAIVKSSTPGAKYFTYASVVDRTSGDPILILPPADPVTAGTDVYLAGAAHVGGAAGTNWRTDLEVHNPGPTAVVFELALLRENQDNLSPSIQTLSLGPGMSVRYEDVLLNVFGVEGAGALRVTPASGTIMVNSRTYNRDFDRTYGQFIAGEVAGEAIAFGQEGQLIQLSTSESAFSGFRTNIGFINTTPLTIEVMVEAPGPNEVLHFFRTSLLPYEYVQLENAIGLLISQPGDNHTARVSTTTPGGSLLAYASVVDNLSGDPVYIPATVTGEAIVAPTTAPVLSVAGTTSSGVWLSWTSVSGATGYRLYGVGGSSPIYQGPNRGYAQTGLSSNTVYCYTISAYNRAGAGPMSAEMCSSTTEPTEPGAWTSTGLESRSVYSIAVCPADPAALSVGSKGHGLWISSDHGNSWRPRNDGLEENEVLETAYPSQDCGLLFAGTWHQEFGNWRGGIYKSTDEAQNWTKKREANVISLAFDVTNPERGFFGTQGSGVYRTTDSGESWEGTSNGIGSLYVRALAISQASPQEVFAGTERGLFKSTNGGDSWFEVGEFYLVDAVAIHPENPLVIYSARYRISKSVDGGLSWEQLDWSAPAQIKSIVIDQEHPSTLFIGTTDGVYMSEDDGSTWSSLNDGLTDRRVGPLALGSGSPRFLYAGTHGAWDQTGDGDVFRIQLP